jgi:CRP/FNR family transcriptional regulator, anaerobic regulatory protein
LKGQNNETPASGHVRKRMVSCESCPLRRLPVFRSFTPEELKFISRFKMGEVTLEAGKILLHEGEASPYLYTLLEGWMYRHKSLSDGRRQILNYSLPGDFVGMQSAVLLEMQHSVEALTDVRLCVFPREKLWSLYSTQPGLGFDLTWLVSREEKMLDDHLLSIGRRSALERMAYLVLLLHRRARDLGMLEGQGVELPLNQQHVADTLGLSIVHTNKTLRKLYDRNVISWKQRTLTVLDEGELARIARVEDGPKQLRPFI